jgi:hypothetical protein
MHAIVNIASSDEQSSSSDDVVVVKVSNPPKKKAGKASIADLFAESDDDDWDEKDGDGDDIEISDEGSDSGMEEMKRIGKARAARSAANKKNAVVKEDENEVGMDLLLFCYSCLTR